jgi:hypothetical protein
VTTSARPFRTVELDPQPQMGILTMRRPIIATILSLVASLAIASSALAVDCMNASKSDQAAGAQVLFDLTTGEIVWMTPGAAQRFEQGLVGPEGEGFHGLIAFDFDGDGLADVSTWVGVGPDGNEVPEGAQLNGPACRGLTDIGVYFTECLGG